MDYDGTFEYSKTVSVQQSLDLDNVFEVYPNPASKGNVMVRILDPELDRFHLQLYDVHGKLYYQGHFESGNVAEISVTPTMPLHKGLYFMELISNGQKKRQKLVVND